MWKSPQAMNGQVALGTMGHSSAIAASLRPKLDSSRLEPLKQEIGLSINLIRLAERSYCRLAFGRRTKQTFKTVNVVCVWDHLKW